MKIRASLALAALIVLATFTPAAAATANVSIGDNFYSPPTVEIAVGDTVVWTHDGQNLHTVTANDQSFDSGIMQNGDTFSQTFNSAGNVSYFCTVHGQAVMSGTVVVQAAATSPGGGGGGGGGGGETGGGEETAGGATTPAPGLPATGPTAFTTALAAAGLLSLVTGGGLLLLLRRRRT